jgi:hypothetical protein
LFDVKLLLEAGEALELEEKMSAPDYYKRGAEELKQDTEAVCGACA